MTEKLYETDGHLAVFEATVVGCEEAGEGRFRVLLDRTAFAAAAGGQEADTGRLGDARVLDVLPEGEESVHLTDRALVPGSTVRGEIDWEPRFRRMQNHSGEHLVSGVVHRLFGYENVGFHLGSEDVTVDFDGELTREQLDRVEDLVNGLVAQNLEVRAWYPTEDELATLDYRSKKELTGRVRIVTVDGVDDCACCAPHVARTGEIGIVKILDAIHYKGGERIHLLCGADALRDYRFRYGQIQAISMALSAKQTETVGAVDRMLEENAGLRRTVGELKRQLLEMRIAALPEAEGHLVLFEPSFDATQLRNLVNAGVERCSGICAAFAGSDGEGYQYVMGSKSVDLRAASKTINAALAGRGGGSTGMIQGSVKASEQEIRAYFETL
jgi:alanyl-tRNA synthetase